jgi:hypothetical protein
MSTWLVVLLEPSLRLVASLPIREGSRTPGTALLELERAKAKERMAAGDNQYTEP